MGRVRLAGIISLDLQANFVRILGFFFFLSFFLSFSLASCLALSSDFKQPERAQYQQLDGPVPRA